MTGSGKEGGETFLLTGATGFLGGHILAGLLAEGKRVVVAGRAASGESLRQRIRKRLHWFGMEQLEGRLDFHEVDFLKKRLGLREDEYERWCARGSAIIHCASDTRFGEKDRARVLRSNVDSLAEVLELARRSRATCFHFISSAYAAGCASGECPEAPLPPARFNNVYEESKALAEDRVRASCVEGGVPYTIIRPSIVYGDSRTGRSLGFQALYYPVRSLLQIRDIYLGDIRDNGGRKSGECGIHVDAAGTLRLPVRIFIPHEGRINLIPVDYFTKTVLAIIGKPGDGMFYHVTSDRPPSMAELASYTERFLNVSGIDVIVGSAAGGMRNPAEELFDYFIRPYRPYISDRKTFLRRNTDRATGGALPPAFSYEIFQRCMEYAVAVGWGKSLFHPSAPAR